VLILKHLDFEDLFETRKILEVKLAGLAAQRATIEDIKIIENILKKMSEKVNQNPYELETEFFMRFLLLFVRFLKKLRKK